jgi:hypothetical protein
MDTDIVKAGPERVAEYLSFLILFAVSPREALRPYAGKTAIDSRLLSFSVLGVSLCIVILLAAGAIGVAEDKSAIVGIVGAIPLWLRPFVAVLVVVGAAIVFHVVGIFLVPLWAQSRLRSTGDPRSPHLGGTHWDSLNAALGFSAFYLPLAFLGYAVILVAHTHGDPGNAWILFLAVMTLISVSFLCYFPAALAATHPDTTVLQAALTLMYALTLMVVVRLVVDEISSLLGGAE